MGSVAELASKLNHEYSNNNLVIKSDIVPTYKRLSIGCMGMDYPLYGGLPYGRIVVFAGQEHSGKTTAAVAALGAYQKENPYKTCVYVDVEHSLDLNFQSLMNHIDLSKLYYFNPEGLSGEQILETILEFEQQDDIGMIVLDSIPALVPSINIENDFTKDTGMRGTIAKYLHKFCTEITGMLSQKQNILLMINQVRLAGTTFTGAPIYTEPGGSACSYYASVKVRFGSRIFMKNDEEIKGQDGEGASGFKLRFKITKNKTAACARGGGFITYDYIDGARYIPDLIEVALTFDFIKRLNNVKYALMDLDTGEIIKDPETGEELANKKAYLIDYLNTHSSFRKDYMEKLKRWMSASNDVSLIDKEITEEIDAEEALVDKSEKPKVILKEDK